MQNKTCAKLECSHDIKGFTNLIRLIINSNHLQTIIIGVWYYRLQLFSIIHMNFGQS